MICYWDILKVVIQFEVTSSWEPLIIIIGMEYIKVLLHKNRMVGAILIGETDLEVNVIQNMGTFMYDIFFTSIGNIWEPHSKSNGPQPVWRRPVESWCGYWGLLRLVSVLMDYVHLPSHLATSWWLTIFTVGIATATECN